MSNPKVTRYVRLSYPLNRVKEPVLYRIILDFDIVPNLLRANIDARTGGFIDAELTGDPDALTAGLKWMTEQGVVITDCENE